MAESTAPTTVSTLVEAVKAAISADVSALAKVIGVWTAARAAVSTVATGIAAAASQSVINAAMAKYHDVPLTPPVLADMVVRNVLSGPGAGTNTSSLTVPPPAVGTIGGRDATAEAALNGIDPDRFTAMVWDTGESYGIIDALRLWNRGKYMYELVPASTSPYSLPLYTTGANLADKYGISDEELAKVLAYSRTRPQFYDDFTKLAKNTLSPADAVELAVKQIVDNDVAQSLFVAAGGAPEQFGALVAASGDSMGVEKAAELHRLGLLTDEQLQSILGLSRLNPRFYDLVPLLAIKQLPPYELRQAVINGTMDAPTAIAKMEAQGYSTADAELFISAVEMGSIGTAKAETEGMVLADWEAGLVTTDQATAALKALGEKDWAIPFILDTVQAKKVTAQRNAVVTRVRAAVLYGDVTPENARSYLVTLGWSTDAAKEVVDGWVIEAETPHELLSTAEIGKLLKDGIVTTEWAVAYWVRRGYTPADAQLLLYIYPPPHGAGGAEVPPPYTPPPAPAVEPLPPQPAVVPIEQTGP